ncbi:uncharacterized protein LDX57_011368 [Aspergillus melleus]|uniref:uncharacterized protein n=1 Tax=Aspergillus melleus TaxID=138277 RepID=UPI001E8CAD55|nr:uncharacterized protein LDX57_011368 [Aspergillus melleus]KAH8433734.1 hypothetical protein LDX57_011368 [Aspergillus melleus]
MVAIFFLVLCGFHQMGLYFAKGPVKRQRQYFLSKKHACPNFFPFENKVDLFGPILRPKLPTAAKVSRAYSSKPKKLPKRLLLFALRLIYWSAMHLGCSVIAIVSVERMILANRLQTNPIPGSVGQILVLAIGAANLVAVLWEITRNFWCEARKSHSRLQDTLSMHTYFSFRPVEEEQLELALQELLYSCRDWSLIPGLYVMDYREESLDSLLRTALLRELVKRLNATVKEGNDPTPIGKYLEIRAVDKMCPSNDENAGREDVALSQAAAHGHLRILQALLEDYGGCGNGNRRKVSLPGRDKDNFEILLPFLQSAEEVRNLCESLKFAEYAAGMTSQWEILGLLEKSQDYLREQEMQSEEKWDTSSTATVPESLDQGLD